MEQYGTAVLPKLKSRRGRRLQSKVGIVYCIKWKWKLLKLYGEQDEYIRRQPENEANSVNIGKALSLSSSIGPHGHWITQLQSGESSARYHVEDRLNTVVGRGDPDH